MSLTTTTSGSRIDHGSATSLDNLDPVTYWAWIYNTATGSNQHIFSKDNSFPSGPLFIVDDVPGNGSMRFLRGRSTTNCDFVTVAGVVALNVPMFVAATYDGTLSPTVDIYTGTVVRPVSEVAYNTSTSGAGTISSDASHLQYVGNIQRSTSLTFKGRIGWYGIINRRLTLGELEQIRTAPTIYDARVSGTVLLSGWQDTTATQIDLSGYGNHGTVTGATVHAPLPARPYRLPIVGRRSAAGVVNRRVYTYILN